MTNKHIRVGDMSTTYMPDSARRDPARRSVRARMTARLRAPRFDRALAVGVPAPAGSALAAHAARLSSIAERHAVAQALRRAVRDANDDPRATRSGRVPMHRANIASAQALIDEVTLRLHAPHPVRARGMARLRQLLSDGRGPLYRYGRGDLAGRLGAALVGALTAAVPSENCWPPTDYPTSHKMGDKSPIPQQRRLLHLDAAPDAVTRKDQIVIDQLTDHRWVFVNGGLTDGTS